MVRRAIGKADATDAQEPDLTGEIKTCGLHGIGRRHEARAKAQCFAGGHFNILDAHGEADTRGHFVGAQTLHGERRDGESEPAFVADFRLQQTSRQRAAPRGLQHRRGGERGA